MKTFLKWAGALLLLGYAGLVVYAYWPTEPGVPAESLATDEDRFAEAAGLKLRYRTWGEPGPDKPALVLIHGFANSVQTFRSLAPELTDHYHVVALDMPGFGLSDKPADHDYSNGSQADTTIAFIDALGLEDVIVGGHSMGGRLALDVASRMPSVRGTILLNPGVYTTGVPPITEYLFFPFPRMSAKMFADPGFRERFVKTSFVRPEIITDEVLEDLMKGPRTDDYYAGATQLMSYYETGDEDGLIGSVRAPSLIVWGTEDKSKPDGEAEKLRDALANSRLVLVPDAGHYVHEEKPVEVARAIIEARDFWAATR